MGSESDDLCNTVLDLGLGLSSSSDNCYKLTKRPSPPQNLVTIRDTSLNLSLSGEAHDPLFHSSDDHIKLYYTNDHHKTVVDHFPRQDSGFITSISFSNYNRSVKTERYDHHQEVEIEKVLLCKAGHEDKDNDDHGTNGRKKLRLTKTQSGLLEQSFKLHSTLNPKQKHDLARDLKLRPRQVEVWFQNRRARSKLKKTELDCELLKKCLKNLKEENLTLHKELQQLKAALKSSPHYMQCPSCEKRSIGSAEYNKTSYSMDHPKPNLCSTLPRLFLY